MEFQTVFLFLCGLVSGVIITIGYGLIRRAMSQNRFRKSNIKF